MNAGERIIVALDELNLQQCLHLASVVGPNVYAIKIHSLWDLHGPIVVQKLRDAGTQRIWVDLKLHDIPNTVRLRASAVCESGANILTVHASGGIDMMIAARKAGPEETYAVTVLTSLNEEKTFFHYGKPVSEAALQLARLACVAGMRGIVCSPKEVGILAQRIELEEMDLIVPGVRSIGKETDDQERVDTPAAAIKAGAHHLVIGRQITQSPDPVAALEEIKKEIEQALAETKGEKK